MTTGTARSRTRTHDDRPGAPGHRRRPWLTGPARERVLRRSYARGLGLLGFHVAAWAVTLLGALAPWPWPLALVAGVANGLAISLLFGIGHDTSHGSFVPGKAWNRWITRFVFLPVAHSASLWDVVHNRNHHGATNLKGVDDVWAPHSLEEYRALPRWRRLVERLYRGPVGAFVYYYFEWWLPRLILPLTADVRPRWREHWGDSVWVSCGHGVLVWGILSLGTTLAPERSWLLVLLLGWALPFAVWNALIGWSIYVQHTHPDVPWFDRRSEWTPFDGNVRGSTHLELPVQGLRIYDWALRHTAHHTLPAIPIYNLPEAQEHLLEAYREDVVRYRFSIAGYLDLVRTCKLYDFEYQRWLAFDGSPTSPALRPSGRCGREGGARAPGGSPNSDTPGSGADFDQT